MSADAWTIADPTLCTTCGREACEDHLPPEGHPQAASPRLIAVRALDLIDAPRPVPIVDGVCYSDSLTVIVAESSGSKTFVAFSLAAAVSDDIPWHGRQTQHGSVCYLSYEGDALGLRLRALRDVAGHRLENLYVIRAHDPLSPHVTREGEVRSIGELAVRAAIQTLQEQIDAARRPPLGLLVIDTARASMTGSEDSSEHVAAYLRAVRRVMALAPGAATVLCHHAGWQDGEQQRKRERGSSAWRGNCDATLYLEAGKYDEDRGEAALTLRTLKVRDAERPAPLRLIRRRVELSVMDRDGRPITSCIIVRDPRSREDHEAESRAAADAVRESTDVAVLKAITDALVTNQKGLREAVGLKADTVTQAVARLLRTALMTSGKRGEPYRLTEAGRLWMAARS